MSPDSSDPATAAIYLAMYGNWKHTAPDSGELSLRAGPKTYKLRADSSKVAVRYLSAAELAEYPMPRRNFEDDLPKFLELAVAPTSGGVAATLIGTDAKALGSLSMKEKSAVIAAVILSGGVGYWLGHHSDPDIENKDFQKALEDVDLWRNFNLEFYECYIAARYMAEDLVKKHQHIHNFDLKGEILNKCKKASPGNSIATDLRQHPEIINQVVLDSEVASVALQGDVTFVSEAH